MRVPLASAMARVAPFEASEQIVEECVIWPPGVRA